MASQSDEETAQEARVALRILLVVLVALVVWGGSVAMWGVPGLYVPALILVPALMGLLVWISRG